MFSNLKPILVVLFATLLVALSLAQPSGQSPVLDSAYKLRAEDTLTITTQDIPEASGDFSVRKDGFISMPLVGDVKVAGLSVAELEAELTQLLKKQVNNPRVTVNLKSTTEERVYIIGSVKNPGFVDWKPQWRVTEAIAAAGGLSTPPERTNVIVFRTGSDHKMVSLKKLLIQAVDSENMALEPGDVLNVQSDETVRVQVVGEVKKPGVVEIIAGQGVAEALAAAGGGDTLSRLSGAKLVRKGQDVPMDLYGAVIKGEPEKNVKVEEDDTLYIPTLLTRVSVIGSVVKPGPITIEDGREETLSSVVTLAGGFAQGAKREGVTVYSKAANGTVVHQNYDMKHMVKNDKKGPVDPVMHDGDIVYVAESGKANAATNAGTFFGAFGVLRYFFP